MDKKTRTIIIIGCIITFIIVPVVTVLILSHVYQKTPATATNAQTKQAPLPNRSNSELFSAIENSQSSLVSQGKPTFAIANVSKPDNGWYVVTIRLLTDTDSTNLAKILLHDSGGNGGLQLLLGPGTDFPDDITQPLGIPSVVLTELNK